MVRAERPVWSAALRYGLPRYGMLGLGRVWKDEAFRSAEWRAADMSGEVWKAVVRAERPVWSAEVRCVKLWLGMLRCCWFGSAKVNRWRASILRCPPATSPRTGFQTLPDPCESPLRRRESHSS